MHLGRHPEVGLFAVGECRESGKCMRTGSRRLESFSPIVQKLNFSAVHIFYGNIFSERTTARYRVYVPSLKYRLHKSTFALLGEEGRRVSQTVPDGAVVTIDSEVLDENKLVEVVWDEKRVIMFAQDVRARGARLE